MRWMKWIGVLSALVLITACFIPWVFIEARQITISGIDASGTNYGKPGYFHFIMCFFFLLFTFIPKVWTKRANLLVVAMNFAWALRNYVVITSCEAGDCPEKRAGIYLVFVTSVVMLGAAVFPDMKLPSAPSAEDPAKNN